MGTRPWQDPKEKSESLSSKAAQTQMAQFNAMFDSAMELRDNKSEKAELEAYRAADQGRSGASKGPEDSVQLTVVQAEALKKAIQAGKPPRLFQDTAGNWSAKFQ
jgi:hypothetical protein